MAYIGKQPVVGNFVKLDAITTSATTTFNLTNGGVAYFPQSANNCIVSLNGVIQSPTSAYTISGSTIVFSDALTSSDTIDFILVLGDVLSIGTPSDNTVSLTKLTATGTKDATTFLRGDNTFATVTADGTVDWDTSVKTTGFTATANKGYFCNTTSAAFTVTLPASPSAGDEVIILDYAGTFDTNKLTISPNGNKIEGSTDSVLLSSEREGVRLVYIDSTQGWLAYSGINEGTDALIPTTYSIDFLVVAGGGGGGYGFYGGGGGAGGYRTSTQTINIGTVITVTVGDGGGGSTSATVKGTNGSNSSISGSGLTTITSAGGGGGGSRNNSSGGGEAEGANGGSGGGACIGGNSNGGSGNTPSTTPSQGNNGGACPSTSDFGSGGGGASAAGEIGNLPSSTTGRGGAGTASSITGSSVTRAGGGGGGNNTTSTKAGGSGGGGAGGGRATPAPTAGTANTGGGGGGAGEEVNGASGGKGVVILSLLTAKYSGTTTGSPTVTTSGSNTILQFNGSGSYTA